MSELKVSGETTTTSTSGQLTNYETKHNELRQPKIVTLPTSKVTSFPDIMKNNQYSVLNHKNLLGGLIAERDICIFWGASNTGKSMFAYQLAQAIGEGKNFFEITDNSLLDNGEKNCYRLNNTLPAQQVLYVDFEMSEENICYRYSYYNAAEDLTIFYQPKNNNVKFIHFDSRAVADKMLYVLAIKKILIETGIKVVFIDNMSNISKKGEDADFAAEFMNALGDMKKDYGLTLILMAHTNKIDKLAIKESTMVKGSSNLENFCESMFCISNTTKGASVRYLKQFKCRYGQKDFEERNVIEIELMTYPTGNKGFIFNGYEKEFNEIKPINIEREEEFINAIKEQIKKDNTSVSETARRIINVFGTQKEQDTSDPKNFRSFRKRVERVMILINKENEGGTNVTKVKKEPVITPEASKKDKKFEPTISEGSKIPTAKTNNSPFVQALIKEQKDKENAENALDLVELLAAEKNNMIDNTTAQ